METELASALFDEQRIVFAKAWAYELNVPQHEAADRLEAFFSANLEKLDSTWITMQNDCMVLTKQREHASSKLFSIQKKSTLDSTVLGLEIEHNRRELVQNDPKERLLHNTLGSVKFADLKVSGSKAPISFKPAAPVPASVAPAKPATTAASFFKKEVEPENKSTMTPIERKAAAAAAAAAAAPKPVEPKKSPVVVSSSSSSEASSSEEEGEEEEELGVAASATKPPPAAKRKAPTKPEAAAKKKKSKVVLSDDDEDDDDEAKAIAKQEKKEAKRLKREEEKLAQKEEKKRHEIELANEAKADFLRHQLGAAPASASVSSNNKVKKRVLKTKTFIDEDGFEVTEDVFEEIEVDEPVVPAPAAPVPAAAPAPVALTKTPSLTKTSKSKPQPSGKQVQLTSFFTKKTKE